MSVYQVGIDASVVLTVNFFSTMQNHSHGRTLSHTRTHLMQDELGTLMRETFPKATFAEIGVEDEEDVCFEEENEEDEDDEEDEGGERDYATYGTYDSITFLPHVGQDGEDLLSLITELEMLEL